MLWHIHPCKAQKNKKEKIDQTDRTPYKAPLKQKDTIPIIYERIPAKEKPKQEDMVPVFKTKEKIIEPVDSKKTTPALRKDLPIVYDTMHVKPKKRNGQEEIIIDTKNVVINMGKPSGNPIVKDTVSQQMILEGNCKCVTMDMKVQDTIDYENYINYRFRFVNKCKEMVLIHSGSFKFLVNDYFGHPVTRIRKVDFVKRFDYPEYVHVSPGETYEFNFADDPFFEYKMSRAQQYRFSFMYNNTHTPAPDKKGKPVPKSHQCLEVREKVVYVR
jgi:hypothetical protein